MLHVYRHLGEVCLCFIPSVSSRSLDFPIVDGDYNISRIGICWFAPCRCVFLIFVRKIRVVVGVRVIECLNRPVFGIGFFIHTNLIVWIHQIGCACVTCIFFRILGMARVLNIPARSYKLLISIAQDYAAAFEGNSAIAWACIRLRESWCNSIT